MSTKQKLRDQFFRVPPPKDFRWTDLVTMMIGYGFKLDSSGGGSHGHFVKIDDVDKVIDISKPHPDGLLLAYQIKGIKTKFGEWGLLK
jgi:hypothetical protein